MPRRCHGEHEDYLDLALAQNPCGRHTPHLLSEALRWHQKYQTDGRI